MNTKKSESSKKSFLPVCFAMWSILTTSCAYRLTNLHTSSPNNIKSIHVAAVYDTSAEAVPHEKLWDELQRAIAANGQLKLTSASSADAELRAHIVKTDTWKSGERKVPTTNRKKNDPNVFAGQSSPPMPGALRDISLADDYFVKTAWSSVVRVEVWDLNSKKLLLQREYPMTGEVMAARGDQPAQIHHVRFEESFSASFNNAAKSVAERVVSDLLVR